MSNRGAANRGGKLLLTHDVRRLSRRVSFGVPAWTLDLIAGTIHWAGAAVVSREEAHVAAVAAELAFPGSSATPPSAEAYAE